MYVCMYILFIPLSAVVPVVVTGFDGKVSPYVVVSVVEFAIDFVALVLAEIVFCAGFSGTNCVELPPSALDICGVMGENIVLVVVWVDVEPLVMVSAVVSAVAIGVGLVTCTYKNRKIKHNTFRTNFNSW